MTRTLMMGIEGQEAEVVEITEKKRHRDLLLVEHLLLSLYYSFAGMPKSIAGDKVRERQFLLVIRSVRSLRWAYEMLKRGFYGEAILLLRSTDENWLVSIDVEKTPETLKKLLEPAEGLQGRLNFAEMAKRMSNEFYEQTWKPYYNLESELSHPKRRALNILVDNDSQTIRLFPQYDPDQFDAIWYGILRQTALTALIIPKLLGETAQKWEEENWLIMQVAHEWMEREAAQRRQI